MIRGSALRARAVLRLTGVLAAVMIVVGLIGLVVQYRTVARALEAQQEALLQADLDGLAALYEERRIPALRQSIEIRSQLGTSDGALYLLLDKSGEKLAGNLPAWPQGVAMVGQGFTTDHQQLFRHDMADFTGVARLLDGGFPLLVARPMAQVAQVLADLRQVIWAVVAVTVVLALVAGYGAARHVMGRINGMNLLIERVSAGDLDVRFPKGHRADEYGLLERRIEVMLDRIGALQSATRRLSDAIAHELRTPLGRIQNTLGRLPADAPGVAEARQELRNTVRIFDSLLDIASAEASEGSAPGLMPLDLSEVAGEVIDLYAPVAEDRGLVLDTALPPGAQVLGDRQLIAQLVSNLVDNALKFTRPGDRVRVTLGDGGDRHLLRVSDTGPGLPQGVGEHAFERFVRAARDQHLAGHGLGLALVRAIATRHGAKLHLLDQKTGFGIEVAWPKFISPEPGEGG